MLHGGLHLVVVEGRVAVHHHIYIAKVVQVLAGGAELVARTIAAVDDVIRDTNEVEFVSFGQILRIFCVLHHRRSRLTINLLFALQMLHY